MPLVSRLHPSCVFLSALAGWWVNTATAQVRLNEFMASNNTTVAPGAVAGTFDDWIELYNEGAAPVDLGGWHLTDNAGNPAKWTFPAGTVIAAHGYLVIFATGANGPDANGNLHTSFSLSAGGEYLGLFQPDGTVAGEFEAGGADYPPQETDVSYGRKPGDGSPVFFATPTPGAANAADGYLRAAAVAVSARRGFYTAPVTVTLSSATAGAGLYYTLDSSPPLQANGTPAATATLYDAPLTLATSTVLRVAATRNGYEPSAVATHTYLFPAAVATQTRPAGYPASWGAEPSADYAVDPAVSQSETDGARFLEGLRALPVLSVSTTMARLFGSSGIYSQPTNENLEAPVSAEYFQAAATGEGVNALEGFQIDAGLRIQGGASRNPNSSIKHSLSLRFRNDYGAGKLSFDLFGEAGGAVTNFNNVQLRAMYNNSWIHSAAEQRQRATLIRDQWSRDSLIEMGQADGLRGHFVHLFLNGLYWGVYNLHERPSTDHYVAYNNPALGEDDIVSYNPGGFVTAEQQSLNSLRTVVNSGNWENIAQRLDVDSYIDYYIVQHFAHNDDLKTDGNWRAAGGGTANAPWRFYLWDTERILENRSNVSTLAVHQDGVNLINALDHLPEFQARFADRAWKHLTHGGALTNERNRARFEARVQELDAAIVGESARWGDDRAGGGGPSGDYTRADNWLPAIYGPLSVQPSGGVLGATGWFPESAATNRTTLMLNAWKAQNWPGTSVRKLPTTDPPAFAVNGTPQHGGFLPSGAALTLTGGTGTLYVTTDGRDPRVTGGEVLPGLAAYTPDAPIPLTASGRVKARWFDGTRWSALNEALFFLEPFAQAGEVKIVEINYHPAEPSTLEQAAGAALEPPQRFVADDFQFIEVLNTADHAVNLYGARFIEGITHRFDNVPLPPGGRAVLVENTRAFAVRYGDTVPLAGVWSGALARSGETLALLTADGAALASLAYSDAGDWPSRPDGDGSTLELRDPAADPNLPASWRSSVEFHGSPGVAGAGADGRVLINEVLTQPADGGHDAIELVNTTAAPLDVSGWFLSDGKSNYRKFKLPEGSVIPAGGYLVFDETHFNTPQNRLLSGYTGAGGAPPVTVTSAAHGLTTGDVITISGYGGFGGYNGAHEITVISPDTFTLPVTFLDAHATTGRWTPGQPFGLSSTADDVWLLEADANGALRRFVDHVEVPASAGAGISFGRWPDASGPLTAMTVLSFGAANPDPDGGGGPTGFEAWAQQLGLPADPTVDSDNDGLSNLAEYALGLDPKQPDADQLPGAVIEGAHCVFRFQKKAGLTDVTVLVQASTDLEDWTTITDTLLDTADGLESRQAVLPVVPEPRRFLRLSVQR